MYSEDEKRKIIMDYYLNKRNRVDEFNNKNYHEIYKHSTSCVDELTLYYNDEKNDFKIKAKGCAIFLSSSEIFIERIKELGFSKKDILSNSFQKLVDKREILDDNEKEILGKLMIYENVAKHLNRKECALLIKQVFENIK